MDFSWREFICVYNKCIVTLWSRRAAADDKSGQLELERKNIFDQKTLTQWVKVCVPTEFPRAKTSTV